MAPGPLPLVSIVLGTYNQAPFVARAIDSALGQSHPNVEVIIIDNGSTDDTPRIVEQYAEAPNLRVHRYDENGPVTVRFNRALDDARGQFVSFLFGDDEYLPEKTERQLACFRELGPDHGVVYGPGFRLNVGTGERWLYKGRGPSGWVARDLITHFHSASLTPIAPLIRAECLSRYRFHEDVFLEGTESLLLRLSLSYKFSYLAEPLVLMRDHPGNHGKAYQTNLRLSLALVEKLRSERDFPRDLDPVITSIKARLLRNVGWATVRLTADSVTARRYFRESVRIQPSGTLHPRIIAGIALSALPVGLRRRLNAIGSLVRRHRSGVEYHEDYA